MSREKTGKEKPKIQNLGINFDINDFTKEQLTELFSYLSGNTSQEGTDLTKFSQGLADASYSINVRITSSNGKSSGLEEKVETTEISKSETSASQEKEKKVNMYYFMKKILHGKGSNSKTYVAKLEGKPGVDLEKIGKTIVLNPKAAAWALLGEKRIHKEKKKNICEYLGISFDDYLKENSTQKLDKEKYVRVRKLLKEKFNWTIYDLEKLLKEIGFTDTIKIGKSICIQEKDERKLYESLSDMKGVHTRHREQIFKFLGREDKIDVSIKKHPKKYPKESQKKPGSGYIVALNQNLSSFEPAKTYNYQDIATIIRKPVNGFSSRVFIRMGLLDSKDDSAPGQRIIDCVKSYQQPTNQQTQPPAPLISPTPAQPTIPPATIVANNYMSLEHLVAVLGTFPHLRGIDTNFVENELVKEGVLTPNEQGLYERPEPTNLKKIITRFGLFKSARRDAEKPESDKDYNPTRKAISILAEILPKDYKLTKGPYELLQELVSEGVIKKRGEGKDESFNLSAIQKNPEKLLDYAKKPAGSKEEDDYVSKGSIIFSLEDSFPKKTLRIRTNELLQELVDKKLIKIKEIREEQFFNSSQLETNLEAISKVAGKYKVIIKTRADGEPDFSQHNDEYIPETRGRELIQKVVGYRQPPCGWNEFYEKADKILTTRKISGCICYIKGEIEDKTPKLVSLLAKAIRKG